MKRRFNLDAIDSPTEIVLLQRSKALTMQPRRKTFYSPIVVTIATALSLCFQVDCIAQSAKDHETVSLKKAFEGKFLVGGTLNSWMLSNPDHPSLKIARDQFDCVTAANAMKWVSFNREPGEYNFANADRFVEFADENGVQPVGHVLYWHSQTPNWVFQDEDGKELTRDALLARMRERAKLMAERYGKSVKIWDVVNEAIEGDGSLRKSKFHNIIGSDFIEQAFRIAAEELPKGAVLIYNDYGMTDPGRRDAVVSLVNDLRSKGVKVDGIGIQGHWSMHRPSIESIEESITAFAYTGLKIHITELDVDYLGRDGLFGADVDIQKRMASPENNPYPDGNFPPEADKALADRYAAIFQLFVKHHESIDRVTFWGVTDADSWLNGWPVRGRTNYPLLFDRKGQAKPAFDRVVGIALGQSVN